MIQSLKNLFKYFTTGGQTWEHAVLMFQQSVYYILSIALINSSLIFIWKIYSKTYYFDWVIVSQLPLAEIKGKIDGTHQIWKITTPQGNVLKPTIEQFLGSSAVVAHKKRCLAAITDAGITSLFTSIIVIILFGIFFVYRGKKHKGLHSIRGAELTTGQQLNKILRQKKMASDLTLGKVNLLKGTETNHGLLLGSTGSGKTQGMLELMDQVRARNEKAIIFDLDGSYIAQFFRAGKDRIINPFDVRGEHWDLFKDCEESVDFEAFAESFMPLHLAGSDPFWIHASRTIFSSAAYKLSKEKNPCIKDLLQSLFSKDLSRIQTLLQNTVAEPMVAKELEKTALSIKSTLSTHCQSLLYLPEVEKPFSIRAWLQNDTDDSWLFLSSIEKNLTAIKPIFSALLDLASREVRSLPPSLSRRVWFLIDELHRLHQLPSLLETLSLGRKYGICFWAALQDPHMLNKIYGQEGARSALSLFNTALYLRNPGANSASWISKALGYREAIENKEGISYGANNIRDGVTINQEKRREPIVLDAQIMFLDDLHGFLKISGDYPIAQVELEIKDRPIIAKPLIQRKMHDITLVKDNIVKKVIAEKAVKEEDQDEKEPISFQQTWDHLESQDEAQSRALKKESTPSLNAFEEIPLPTHQNTLFHAVAAVKNLSEGKPLETILARKAGKLRKSVARILSHADLQNDVLQFALKAHFKDEQAYLKALSEDFPGDTLSIQVLSELLSANFYVYQNDDPNPFNIQANNLFSITFYLRNHHRVYSILVKNHPTEPKSTLAEKIRASKTTLKNSEV